jgi:hypothetical protein
MTWEMLEGKKNLDFSVILLLCCLCILSCLLERERERENEGASLVVSVSPGHQEESFQT